MRMLWPGSAITYSDENPQEASASGGAGGALTGEILDNIIHDNERVRAAFTSPDGLSRISGEEERHVAFTVVMVVTDRRILFVAGESTPGELGADAGTLAYDDLAAVAVEGTDPSVLALSMANGVRWEFPLPEVEPETVDAVVRHLRWVGEVRSRLVACRNDVEMTAGEIREAADAMEWEAAEDFYEAQREQLDQLICAVQWTGPIEDHVIAPELTDMERTLERAYARLYIERANSQLELGQQLVENEDYSQAKKVLQSAQAHYERASERADAVERGDAFRFGEQRELRDELDRLEWEIEAVAAEPLRRAHEAKIRAQSEQDLAVAIDHWETAFRRYGNVLTLDWDDDQHFAGDHEEVRAEMETAAEELVGSYRELAREKWNEGVTLERNDAVKSALRACTAARDHLDRALELAEEFRPGEAPAIEQRRDKMGDALREMRDTATVDRASARDGTARDETAEAPAGVGSADSIDDIDTHQDITFDATVDESAADGGRHRKRGFQASNGEQATGEAPAEEGENADDPRESAFSPSE